MVNYIVYGITDKITHELIYIGSTVNYYKRCASHFRPSLFRQKTAVHLYFRTIPNYRERFYMHIIKEFSTEKEMMMYEKENIRTYKPRCNVICYITYNITSRFISTYVFLFVHHHFFFRRKLFNYMHIKSLTIIRYSAKI